MGAIPTSGAGEQGCPAVGLKCSRTASGTNAYVRLTNKQTPATSLGHTPLLLKEKYYQRSEIHQIFIIILASEDHLYLDFILLVVVEVL